MIAGLLFIFAYYLDNILFRQLMRKFTSLSFKLKASLLI